MGNMRTFVLMAVMTALFMGLGAMIGGGTGALIALVVAGGMNVMAFWNSDKAVLSMAGAREVDSRSAPDLVRMVHEMSDRAGLPRPRVYVIETDQPNAFATGRNPDNAAVAATTGLLHALSREEIAAVMAHELAHVKHRDTLTMTITATMAGAISMLANFGMFFGGNDRDRPGGMLGTIILMIVAPLAAGIVQMAISRSREYEADRLGAEICGDAGALASALQKIEAVARGEINVAAERNPAIAHMFIINPLNGKGADSLFSTHPSTANRVAALMKLAPSITPGREAGRGSVRRDPGAASGWAPPPAPKAATPPADLGAGSIPKISRRPRRDDRDNPWS